MKREYVLMAALLGALALVGCGGGDGNSGGMAQDPPPGNGPGDSNDFTAFVKTQIANTSDTTQPVPINGIDFTFKDQDNPAAFDDILQRGP